MFFTSFSDKYFFPIVPKLNGIRQKD